MLKITTIGNPVYDYIETPYIKTEGRILSGCSTNTALVASRLGAEVTIIGCIGEDYKDHFSKTIIKDKINCSMSLGGSTGGFSLVYDALGRRELKVLGVAYPISDAEGSHIRDCDYVMFGPILGEISLEFIKRATKEDKSYMTLLDPQGALRRLNSEGNVEHYLNPDIYEMIKLCDIVKANELETRIITGIDVNVGESALRDGVRALYDIGCNVAIVTIDSRGSIIYDGSSYHRIKPYKVNAIDPTGAGDSYSAGFMYGMYISAGDLLMAGECASCVASVAVENIGPDFPIFPYDINERMYKLHNES